MRVNLSVKPNVFKYKTRVVNSMSGCKNILKMDLDPPEAKERMENYEALMQELEGAVEAAEEANIMHRIVEILRGFFQSPFDHTQHIRASSKALTGRDMTTLLVPKSDVESKILPLLNPQEDLKTGVPVMVYGRGGLGYPITFKFWRPSCVLCRGWSRFVDKQGFQVNDIVTLWLFSSRHPTTNMLRFAVTTHPVHLISPQ